MKKSRGFAAIFVKKMKIFFILPKVGLFDKKKG